MKANTQYRVIKRASLGEKPYIIERRQIETRCRYFGVFGPYETWGDWLPLREYLTRFPAQYSSSKEASDMIDEMIKEDRARQKPDEVIAVFE